MADIDLQTVLAEGDLVQRSGDTLVGISPAELAANAAFTGEYATIADLATAGPANPVETTDTSTAGWSFVVDEDDMASNLATKVPTQQSVKAFVEAASLSGATINVGVAGAIIVASTDAPAGVKAAANFTCDGTADQVQINDAITLAAALSTRNGPAGGLQAGTVLLTGGRFNLSGSILMRTGVTLRGQGVLTEIRAVSLSTATGNGTGVGMIKLNDANVHLCRVTNIWLHGDFASGGTCSGILFDGTGGGDQTGYPNSDPDCCNTIDSMFVSGFTTGTRHGIWIRDTQMRGIQIYDIWEMRSFSGHAIFIDGAPDGLMNNIHIGTVTQDGVRIDGGNWKVFGVKAFYCDSVGINILNSRTVAGTLEVQDCLNGLRIAGTDCIVEGVLIDNCDVNGLEIAASRVKCSFSVLHRSGGRYANMNVGVQFTGSPTGVNVQGTINTATVTTSIAGTRNGSANFVRISHGSTLDSVG